MSNAMMAWRTLFAFFISLTCALQVAAQTGASASLSTPPPTSFTTNSTSGAGGAGTATSAVATSASAPDVYLNVPTLSVGKIQLVVEDLQAEINLAAQVASLVSINAGVQVGITKVNLTIVDVDAELELVIRLGQLADIVDRTLQSLDLNPLLIDTLNNVTSAVDDIVGEVDGLLGSITQGGSTLSFLVDNLGNIVQQGVGGVSKIVGNYLQNMTLVAGSAEQLAGGQVQKTYSYSPLGALVNIIFNSAGQIVQAVVQSATSGGSSSATARATSTAKITSSSAKAATTKTRR